MSRYSRRFLIAMSTLALTSAYANDGQMVGQGHQVFAKWCLPCHGPGQHTPGTMALYFKYEGKASPLLEHRADMSPDYLKVLVRNGISVMPSFRRTEVSDQDIDAIAAYLKTTSAKAALSHKQQ